MCYQLAKDIPVENREAYEKVVANKGITSGLNGACRNWLVSNEGDIIYVGPALMGGYSIFSYQLFQEDWESHLSYKDWFTFEDAESFQTAFKIATSIIKKLCDNDDLI